MSLNAKKVKPAGSKSKQPIIEPGTYPARLVQLIDLGVQPQRPFKGTEKPPVHMISTTYEFSDEFILDENGEPDESKPRWLSEDLPFYSLDQDRAKSTQRYKALDPTEAMDGEWPELLGSPVMITVGTYGEPDNLKNCILSTSTVRSKQAATMPELKNKPKVFLLDDPDVEVFLSLPQWMQDKIKGNLHYQGSALQKALDPKAKTASKAKAPKVEEDNSEEDDSDNVW
jgi:hypothetical protein